MQQNIMSQTNNQGQCPQRSFVYLPSVNNILPASSGFSGPTCTNQVPSHCQITPFGELHRYSNYAVPGCVQSANSPMAYGDTWYNSTSTTQVRPTLAVSASTYTATTISTNDARSSNHSYGLPKGHNFFCPQQQEFLGIDFKFDNSDSGEPPGKLEKFDEFILDVSRKYNISRSAAVTRYVYCNEMLKIRQSILDELRADMRNVLKEDIAELIATIMLDRTTNEESVNTNKKDKKDAASQTTAKLVEKPKSNAKLERTTVVTTIEEQSCGNGGWPTGPPASGLQPSLKYVSPQPSSSVFGPPPGFVPKLRPQSAFYESEVSGQFMCSKAPSSPMKPSLLGSPPGFSNYSNSPGQFGRVANHTTGSRVASPASPSTTTSPIEESHTIYKGWCPFCKKNGEEISIYTSHNLYYPGTCKVMCPVLRKFRCEFCGATGDFAHTKGYCKFSHS